MTKNVIYFLKMTKIVTFKNKEVRFIYSIVIYVIIINIQ